jgi:hypothetical protein
MHTDNSNLVKHLEAIDHQLAALQEQLAALCEQHKTLCAVVQQRPFLTGPAEQSAAAASEVAPGPAQETLAECARDIVRVLREAGHPLTTLEILEQLVGQQLRWRESTAAHALVELVDHGVVATTGENGAHHYRLATPR